MTSRPCLSFPRSSQIPTQYLEVFPTLTPTQCSFPQTSVRKDKDQSTANPLSSAPVSQPKAKAEPLPAEEKVEPVVKEVDSKVLVKEVDSKVLAKEVDSKVLVKEVDSKVLAKEVDSKVVNNQVVANPKLLAEEAVVESAGDPASGSRASVESSR